MHLLFLHYNTYNIVLFIIDTEVLNGHIEGDEVLGILLFQRENGRCWRHTVIDKERKNCYLEIFGILKLIPIVKHK